MLAGSERLASPKFLVEGSSSPERLKYGVAVLAQFSSVPGSSASVGDSSKNIKSLPRATRLKKGVAAGVALLRGPISESFANLLAIAKDGSGVARFGDGVGTARGVLQDGRLSSYLATLFRRTGAASFFLAELSAIFVRTRCGAKSSSSSSRRRIPGDASSRPFHVRSLNLATLDNNCDFVYAAKCLCTKHAGVFTTFLRGLFPCLNHTTLL